MGKYHNRRCNGYDSKKEAELGAQLDALACNGQIQSLEKQKKFELLPPHVGKFRTERALSYKADFCYEDKDGRHVIDVKGYRTREYVIKRKLMAYIHGIEIEEM